MNFHSRWWWWDRIQDVSLNLFYFKVDDDEAMVSTPNVKSLALKKSERKMWVQIKATSDAIEINMDEDRPASFESKDLGSDFVFWICLQSSQILSHKRSWHKNDKNQKLSNLQNFNFQVKKWPKHQFFQTIKCQMAILI